MQNSETKYKFTCVHTSYMFRLYIATSAYMYNQVRFSFLVLVVLSKRVIFGPRTSSWTQD